MLYRLFIQNAHAPDDGSYISNDEELNHVDRDNAGQFTRKEVLSTLDYIIQHVDALSTFRIEPIINDCDDTLVLALTNRLMSSQHITIGIDMRDNATECYGAVRLDNGQVLNMDGGSVDAVRKYLTDRKCISIDPDGNLGEEANVYILNDDGCESYCTSPDDFNRFFNLN